MGRRIGWARLAVAAVTALCALATWLATTGQVLPARLFACAVIVGIAATAYAIGRRSVSDVLAPPGKPICEPIALCKGDDLLRLITQSLPVIIAYLDADRRYRFCNKTYEQWFGVTPESILGRHASEVLGPDAYTRIAPHMDSVLRGTPTSFEVYLEPPGLPPRHSSVLQVPHLAPDGRVLGYVVLATDVTRPRSAEAALQRSEDRYRSFIAHSTEGIWRFESEDPTPITLPEDEQISRWYCHHFLAECNDAMARMYGHNRAEDLIGARLNQLLVTGNPANWEFHRQFIRNGYRMTDAESCEVDRAGNLKYFLNNFVGTIEDGKLVRVWGTQRDITTQKQYANERARLLEREQHARAEAERANRAKDEFIAVLSHELRTPLTPVLLGVSMLESRTDLPHDVRDDLRNMRTDIELEARLIDDLLDLTRIRLGKLQLHVEQVDAHELIRRTVEMCGRNGGARVTLDLLAQHHHLRADSVRLQQVLWNLVNNALKFTPLDGAITVRTANEAPNPSTDQSGPTLSIQVIDTGIGFDPAAGARLFDAFDQGDLAASRHFGGLGLGLAISRALTQASGGYIDAHSDGPNTGATFTLQLPTITVCANQVPLSITPDQAARPLRLLLVEDHDSTRRLLAKLLESFGHHITPAASVTEALSLADHNDYDLIISDIGLPDGSGHDLMRKLRDRFRGIALTGYGMEDDIQRSSDAGFLDHLTKPVDARKLEQAIHRAIRRTSTLSPTP